MAAMRRESAEVAEIAIHDHEGLGVRRMQRRQEQGQKHRE
jgi:hypothetical protein